MSDDITEMDWELHVAEFFPRCPLCGSKSLEFDIQYGRPNDYIHCLACKAEWEIDWKGEDFKIESIALVKAGHVERIGLKKGKHSPEFWLRMALKAEKVEPIAREREVPVAKEKEVIREKEVIIKVRCQYCGKLYNEVLDVCPHCGGKR